MKLLSFVVTIAVAVPTSCPAQTAPAQMIRDVRVFDGTAVHEHQDVLIKEGLIAVIGRRVKTPSGATVISGAGRTLLPGLIDAHVHIPKEASIALQQGIDLGVTTQLDMYSSPDKLPTLKSLEQTDGANLSDLRTAGMGATVPGGHPTPPGGGGLPTLTRPEEAQTFVDARIAEGSDYIKVVLDDFSEFHRQIPTLDDQTLRAIVVAAHQRSKLVIAHVLTAKYAREAIEAGVDGLAHMYEGAEFEGDFGAFAAQHHIFVIPTLSVIYLDCGESPGPYTAQDSRLSPYIRKKWIAGLNVPPNPKLNNVCDSTRKGMKQLVTAGVSILAGTDAPVQGTTYGASLHEELRLLVSTGLMPMKALTAATEAPARIFHLDDRGRIAAGLRADLVLVEGDPTKDIAVTENIVTIWKKGIPVNRVRPE